jgi:hypothetical protein
MSNYIVKPPSLAPSFSTINMSPSPRPVARLSPSPSPSPRPVARLLPSPSPSPRPVARLSPSPSAMSPAASSIPLPPIRNSKRINTRSINDINRNIKYLQRLGFTKNTNNETWKDTLSRYKNITGNNWVQSNISNSNSKNSKASNINSKISNKNSKSSTINSKPPTINSNSSELKKVEEDLTYFSSLGLTANSGNESYNKSIKKYKELTGKNYKPISGGKKKSKSRKLQKRKIKRTRK